MTSLGMAAALLSQAENVLREAERHLAHGAQHGSELGLAVRRSQEAVELALKGLLRSAGIEAPKIHDVGKVLLRNAARLGQFELQRLAALSQGLARDRSAAFYGEDGGDRGPDELFSLDDARTATADARWAVERCRSAT